MRGATKQINQQFEEKNVDLAQKFSQQNTLSTLSSGYSVRKLWRKWSFTKRLWNREWGKAEGKVERFLWAFDIPQCRRVQFTVHKIDNFKRHGDAQSSQRGNRHFEPWHICSFKKKPGWSMLCCTSRVFLIVPGPVSRSYVTETLDQCKSDWRATAVRYQSILAFFAFQHHMRLLWRIRNHFQLIDSRFWCGITAWVGDWMLKASMSTSKLHSGKEHLFI